MQEHVELLHFLMVTHIISTKPLNVPTFDLIFADEKQATYLYKSSGRPQAGYFVTEAEVMPDWNGLKDIFMKPGFDPKAKLLLKRDWVWAKP